MIAIPSEAAPSGAFEIDLTVAPVTVLRLRTADVGQIEEELRARIASVGEMFPYAPVVVDMAELDEFSAMELPLHDLADRLRACKLVPVGAANLPPAAVWNAAAAGMAVVQLASTHSRAQAPGPPGRPAPRQPADAEAPRSEPPPPPAVSTVTIRQPVRSGQVIYAQRADLVVLAPVNAGAQVIADGHIHIYGALRGRALAGAQGMADARIFCDSLEAELVSVAGQYLVADEIPAEHRGRRTQIFVEEGHFHLQRL